jgi:hypothetical protein
MGSGFRTFTAGEVLTASNVQNYLQDQVVMTFAGSAARSSAIGTANFEEGMTSYLTDTDKMEVYNGTNWVSVAPTSTQGLTLLQSVTFSGVSSVSLPTGTFTSTYDNYKIIISNVTSSVGSSQDISMRLRKAGTDNTSAIYYRQFLTSSNTTVIAGKNTAATTMFIGQIINTGFQSFSIEIFNPQIATSKTAFLWNGMDAPTTSPSNFFASGTHDLNSSADFDSVTIACSSGNMTGTIYAYAYNK